MSQIDQSRDMLFSVHEATPVTAGVVPLSAHRRFACSRPSFVPSTPLSFSPLVPEVAIYQEAFPWFN